MAILSDADIRQEIGNNILIYPFQEGYLKGASYNLSASKLAWDLATKKNIYVDQEKAVIIPPNSTAVIETNETIWVSQKIAGTYHSRVSQVSHGTGHIGTTLDPNYIGPSLIAVHNHSNEAIKIPLETEPFLTLTFHYLHTASLKEQHGNSHARRDVLATLGIILTQEENQSLDQPYMSDKVALKAKMEECQDFKTIQKNRAHLTQNSWLFKLLIVTIIATLVATSAQVILSVNETKFRQVVWYETATVATGKFIELLVIVWVTLGANYVINKSQK